MLYQGDFCFIFETNGQKGADVIDTCEVTILGPSPSRSDIDLFLKAVPGAQVTCGAGVGPDGEIDAVPFNYTGMLPGFGRVRLDIDGCFRMGRSLAKTRQELLLGWPADQLRNDWVMTAHQVNETYSAWVNGVQDVLPWLRGSEVRLSRADVVYDRRVEDSLGVVSALKAGIKPTRGGAAWFDNGRGEPTGLILRGKAVVHRIYDKGLEQGNPDLHNVLRSEEQLRRGSRGLELAFLDGQFSREGCIEVLNGRYLDVGYGAQLDLASLLLAGYDPRVILFVEHPEWLPRFRQDVSRTTYWRVESVVRALRASAVPVDLRVPEDAFTDILE